MYACDKYLGWHLKASSHLPHADRKSQIRTIWVAIANPLSELEQKTDSLCLPNLELLMFVLACVAKPIALRQSQQTQSALSVRITFRFTRR